jgi:acetylornithine deacetylase/succinyl-diaminopimelate desuccinylase-like protein
MPVITTDFNAAVTMFQELLRFNTTNPPGDEEEAVLYLEDILQRAGAETKIFLPARKRANLYAKIRGKEPGRPIVLLGHVDVVPAREDEWDVDPFGGVIRDGFIYGRGTIDMKGQVICQLVAFLDLLQSGRVPKRDIIFLATADEEVGGVWGVKNVIEAEPELKDASFVLSEGGGIIEEPGFVHAQVSVTEKEVAQFIVRARGKGGHGSMPHPDSANEKVLRAAHRILSHRWPLRPTKIAGAYLKGILQGNEDFFPAFADLKEALKKKAFRQAMEGNPVYNALLRNTVTPTILKGGEKINVIPAQSEISFDARLLPDQDAGKFLKKIERLAGPDVEVTPVQSRDRGPRHSGFRTAYFKGIEAVTKESFGNIPVLPFITTGATDLRYFRQLGITAYGFFPARLPLEDLFRMHGADERLALSSFREGLEGTKQILYYLAGF